MKQYAVRLIILSIVGLLTISCGNIPIAQPETKTTPITPVTAIVTVVSTPTVLVPTLTPTFAVNIAPISTSATSNQTIMYTVDQSLGQEIYKIEVDSNGQPLSSAQKIDFPTRGRTLIHGLYPSPDKQHVAIMWQYGDGAIASVEILEVATGKLTPLLGEKPKVDPLVWFLDWQPDSQAVLVNAVSQNRDLHDKILLIDINTHTYTDTKIKQTDEFYPYIINASFSPDGKTIIYSQQHCGKCDGELWKTNLDSSNHELLVKSPLVRIEDIVWSPDGKYIAFTQWAEYSANLADFSIGELGLIKSNGSDNSIISSIVVHSPSKPFKPVWSPDSQQIAFVKSENSDTNKKLENLVSNIYAFNLKQNQIIPLTHFTNSQVLRPLWTPNRNQLTFLATAAQTNSLQTWSVSTESTKSQTLQILNLGGKGKSIQPVFSRESSFIWLP